MLPKKTQPPARFTEGTLIAAMKNIAKVVDEQALKKTLRETAGIGTEATRADILEKLVYREYVVRKQKQLISTEKGRRLISILPEAIKNPATTAQWEQVLDDIAQGKAELDTFLLDQIECLDFLLEDLATIRHQRGQGLVASETYPCPQCQAPLARRRGKHGYFWGCTRYPECDALLQDHDGKPQSKVAPQVSTITCPLCQRGKLARRRGKKDYFWGCNRYPDCKGLYWDHKGKPNLQTPQRGQQAIEK